MNLLVFRLLRRRNWSKKSVSHQERAESSGRMKLSPSLRRLKEHVSSSNASMYVDEMSDESICLNSTLKLMIVDEKICTRVKSDDDSMFEIEKSSALKWFQKHIQSVSDESQAESVFNAMVDSGMLIPILTDDDLQKYVTLGSSLCYRGEDEKKIETTTLEIESDAVFRFCADSDASIDRSGTVLFEIRRMVNAALRHTRRLLRKAESTSKLDSNFVKRVSSETDTIETSMNTITSQDIVKISSRIDDANRKKEIETALIGVKQKMETIGSVLRCTIDSIRVFTDFETKHENVLKITEHADSSVVSSMNGYRCDGTGSGSLKYARSALLILERKLIQLSEIQDKIDRGNAVELPEVYWNIKMHDAHGKVVAHDSITSK